MVDREKVIKGLECCMSGQPDGLGCSRVPCPYNQFEDCEGMLHRDALALLKAQEPITPVMRKSHSQGADDVWYECGGCGGYLGIHSRAKKFCDRCGRPVKWE